MTDDARDEELARLRATVAEQQAHLQEVSRLANRYRQLLDTAPDAMVIVDRSGVIQLVNGQTERLFGWRREDLQGKSLDVLIPERFRNVHGGHVQRFTERAHPRPMGSGLELFGRRADGSEVPVEVSLSPYRGEDGITISAAIRDISERKALEQIATTARAVAEAANAAKTEFLSSMSHELRTPMNAILGFAQLLRSDKREPLSARHAQRVDHILRGGEHLLRLIDDILDLSRIESGNVAVSLEPVAVPELLGEVLTTLEPSATRGSVTMRVEPSPLGCPLVRADRTRLVQILVNFGSNAIKYNRAQGNVSIAVSLPDDERVRVTVSDTGWGIATDKQDKLFQPFQRAGQETGPIEGTGIGLVISKRLAEMMGGCVGFHSVPERGSEFWVDLPVVRDTTRAVAPAASESALGTRTGGDRLLLYVEDNPANVAFMTDVIDTLGGFTLLTAPTAETGIELARSERPDLILMDVNLPEMSGMEAMNVLRADDRTRNIPVIALTAAASERDRRAGREAGFRRYLAKPVDIAELTRAIDDVLGTT